jgi:hypothetical protein
MSARRDDTQRISFVYSNLYEIYRRGKQAAQAAPNFVAPEFKPTSGVVIKSEDAKKVTIRELTPPIQHEIEEYRPVELLGKAERGSAERRNPRSDSNTGAPAEALPASMTAKIPAAPVRAQNAVESLKHNLKNLNELHTRLQFMLKEIEELMKS